MFSCSGLHIFFNSFLTTPVTAAVTGIIIHLILHVRCISIHKLLYFSSFSVSFRDISVRWFCRTFGTHVSSCLFSINMYIWPVCCNFCVCIYPQHCHVFMFTLCVYVWCVCVCVCVVCVCVCVCVCVWCVVFIHFFILLVTEVRCSVGGY